MKIEDTKIILPEIDAVEITDRKTKEKYTVDLFVPAAVGIKIINSGDVMSGLLAGKFDAAAIKFVMEIFESMFKPQYDIMDAKWCEKNIGLTDTILYLTLIAKPVYDFLSSAGYVPASIQEKIAAMATSQSTSPH